MKTYKVVYMVVAAVMSAAAENLYVECENFRDLGGWIVDPHSMRQIGSSYVMAHGYGTPVKDAVTTAKFPAEGRYAVWARTRNWNAVWTKGAAGRFQVLVDGKTLPAELGTLGKDWDWQLAGHVDLKAGVPVEIRLRDLTGFNGRCDALWFTTEFRRCRRTNWRRCARGRRSWGCIVSGMRGKPMTWS